MLHADNSNRQGVWVEEAMHRAANLRQLASSLERLLDSGARVAIGTARRVVGFARERRRRNIVIFWNLYTRSISMAGNCRALATSDRDCHGPESLSR